MATSLRSFYRELYAEHLEEASFVYEQRLGLLEDPEVSWVDIGDFEERLEAHLDALVLGEELALEVCTRQAAEGDFGELHAALRVFCRRDRRDLVEKALEELDSEDEERRRAAADALSHELPPSWQGWLAGLLSGGDDKLVRIAARVLGYRRAVAGAPLLAALERGPGSARADVAWALGRLREACARESLLRLLVEESRGDDGGVEIRREAALALLRLHDRRALEACQRAARDEEWPLPVLAVGGGAREAASLLERVRSGRASAAGLLALGILGDPSSVPVLLESLGAKETAAAGALALTALTGADLQEDVFVPEEIDEDTLFADELERLRRGEPVLLPGQPPPGENVRRIAQDPSVWTAWWREHRGGFEPGVRYRAGRPCSPAVLLDELEAPGTPHTIRRLGAEELVVRYGAELEFEPDLLVAHQRRVLCGCRERLEAQGTAGAAGSWVLGGQRLEGAGGAAPGRDRPRGRRGSGTARDELL